MTELETKLYNYINEKFPLAYTISKETNIFLIGGAIRSIMFDEIPRDLDFVVYENKNLSIVDRILKENNITPSINNFGGYKIKVNDTSIDLWTTDDIFTAIEYNVDGLLFNLNDKKLVSITFNDFEENGLKLINDNSKKKNRYEKLKRFEKRYFNE